MIDQYVSSVGQNIYVRTASDSANMSTAWTQVLGADASSFGPVTDPENPVILDINQETGVPWYGKYFEDKRSVYVLVYSNGGDASTAFRRIDGIDPSTFKIVPSSSYYRDSYVEDHDHVFYVDFKGQASLVTGADAATFELDRSGAQYDARDSATCYFRGGVVSCTE